MQNIQNIAKHFIDRAFGNDENNDLTNLKLQKMLYYAQGEFFLKNKAWLFDDQIEAWKFGPVVKAVYNKYKKCGNFPITIFDTDDTLEKTTNNVSCFLDEVFDKYNKFSAAYLVNHSHKNGSCWDIAYNKQPDVYNCLITTDLMKKNFEAIPDFQ